MDIHDNSFLTNPNKYLVQPLPESLKSSYETMDAALWLIAGTNLPQALSLLHNAIELALKAELGKIHPLLIVDSKKLDYETLKTFLKSEFLKHPKGDSIRIKEPDLERTITFTEAVNRNKEIYPELFKQWESHLKELQEFRNQIIHAGAKSNDNGKYAYLIASVAIPFLNEFFWVSNQVLLEKELDSGIYREIIVAKKISDRLYEEKLPFAEYVLRTLRWKMLDVYSHLPQPEGEEGWKVDFERNFVLGIQGEKSISREWLDDYFVEVICHICGSVKTFVKVQPVREPKLGIIPLAVYCPVCGLKINESDKYLALYHIGEFQQGAIDKFFEENHGALKYDGFF